MKFGWVQYSGRYSHVPIFSLFPTLTLFFVQSQLACKMYPLEAHIRLNDYRLKTLGRTLSVPVVLNREIPFSKSGDIFVEAAAVFLQFRLTLNFKMKFTYFLVLFIINTQYGKKTKFLKFHKFKPSFHGLATPRLFWLKLSARNQVTFEFAHVPVNLG